MAKDTIPVKYVGIRKTYTDGCYGTHITWARDEILNVPVDDAVKMLKHPDVWIKPKLASKKYADKVKTPKVVEKEVEPEENEDDIISTKLNLKMMDEDGLRKFAHNNFAGHKIPATIKKPETMVKHIEMLIDQYSLPK